MRKITLMVICGQQCGKSRLFFKGKMNSVQGHGAEETQHHWCYVQCAV